MEHLQITALLDAAPREQQRQCEMAHRAIDSSRWPAAACSLRRAAAMAREWADQVAQLADHCDAQSESGRTGSTVAPTLVEITEPGTLLELAGPITLEALEAGLMALAHHIGREHAVHTRRAMVNVLRSQAAPIAVVA